MAELNVKGLKELCKGKDIQYPVCLIDEEYNVIKEYESVEAFTKSTDYDKKQIETFLVGIRDGQTTLIVNVLETETNSERIKVSEVEELCSNNCMYTQMHRHLADMIRRGPQDEEEKLMLRECLAEYKKLYVESIEFVTREDYEDDEELDYDDEYVADIMITPQLPEGILLWDTFTDYDF